MELVSKSLQQLSVQSACPLGWMLAPEETACQSPASQLLELSVDTEYYRELV